MDTISLKTGSLDLSFDQRTGALIRLTAPATGWTIHRREALGLSFRLLVPLNDELRNNNVYGELQTLAGFETGNDFVKLIWDGLTSEKGGKLDIKVTLTVKAEGRQAVFAMEIDNKSPYMVETAYVPYLGDLTRPEGAGYLKGFLYSYAAAQEWNMWPTFTNMLGYYGVDFPTQIEGGPMGSAPMSPFFLMRSENQGLYAGIKAPSEELVAWHAELRPGYGESIDARVPITDEIAGLPVHTRFAAVHECFIQPGDSRALTPVALEAYEGGWQQGVDIYKAWAATWLKTALPVAKWAREPHSWLQLHINSPEDELRLKFVDLPKVAAECAQHGVKAIQLVGWNHGGQDQGNPSHEPDPRLGTFDELKAAIAQCQRLGVKIILFAKFVWTDRGTKWFRDGLIDEAIKDPYGDYYLHPGYKYQTATQLLDINTKRLIPMCFASEKYMQVCRDEFQKIMDLGADGFLFDECLHHGPALLCFASNHGHRYGWPVYQNDRQFIRMLEKMPGLRPDFLFAGEACYDWELEAYNFSYHRSENKRHIALSRYMRPDAQLMTAVTGFDDRNMVNQCLLCRYVISYEPFNFKGWLHDYPDTVKYGNAMDALRTKYRAWLWDGEYRDQCGAKVTKLCGAPHQPYAVFRAQDGTDMLVICNYEDAPVTVNAVRDIGKAYAQYRAVEDDTLITARGGIVIPARSAVVLMG